MGVFSKFAFGVFLFCLHSAVLHVSKSPQITIEAYTYNMHKTAK